ncbi:cupredoxin domain-containing protein [Tychonema sp. BBK16]|uniref:cupredoxin domain-containing protein n=1 Tax=Tychonema sp. BBK16 TaxID=2699888 RepID=UPI0038D2C795
MLYHHQIWGTLASVGIAIGMASGVQATEMSVDHSNSTTQFRTIEQPLGLKVAVTLGGLTLIGVELWWFLFNKSKGQQAESIQGIQELTITVDGGYNPATVVVKVGQLVRLNFLRRDPNSCLEKVLLPDFHIMRELPLNQVTAVEFTPEKPGRYPFTCGMNMFRGVVEVQG